MKPAWPTPSPSTRPCSSPSIAVRVSGWSVMINNSPRSVPAGSSATSKHPRRPAPDRAAPLHQRGRSSSITRPPRRPPRGARLLSRAWSGACRRPRHDHRGCVHRWVLDRRPGLTRSCSPPPASWSPNSTVAPVITASTAPPDAEVRLADGNQASVGDVIITRATTADSASPRPTG